MVVNDIYVESSAHVEQLYFRYLGRLYSWIAKTLYRLAKNLYGLDKTLYGSE